MPEIMREMFRNMELPLAMTQERCTLEIPCARILSV